MCSKWRRIEVAVQYTLKEVVEMKQIAILFYFSSSSLPIDLFGWNKMVKRNVEHLRVNNVDLRPLFLRVEIINIAIIV